MRIPFGQTFDQLEFFEFLWLYERLTKEKQKESENINNSKTLKSGQSNLAEEMMKSEGLV